MFTENSREQMRQVYINSWKKYQSQQTLEALEEQIVNIIIEHPEYQPILEQDSILDKDYTPESGAVNPFLHMGLHLAIREQVQTNRPAGITQKYNDLRSKYSKEKVEHLIMDCLIEALWQSQRSAAMPDEQAYIECIKAID